MPEFGSPFTGLAPDEEKLYAEGAKEVEEGIKGMTLQVIFGMQLIKTPGNEFQNSGIRSIINNKKFVCK